MTTLLYLLAAVFCLGLALRAWNGDRDDPIRRAFVVLGAVTGIFYAGFALFLLPGLEWARYIQSGAAPFIPAAMLWFLERLLRGAYAPASRTVTRLWLGAPLAAVAFLVTDITFYQDVPRASPPEVLLAIWCYGGLLLCMHRLWAEHERADSRVDRARLRYLLFLLGAAIAFSLIEDLIRGLGPVPDPSGGLAHRAAQIQGGFPPVSTVFTTLFIYFLYQVVQLTRLLDLHEIFSRIFTLAIAGLLLVVVDGVSVLWLGGLTASPVHGTFEIFLASVLFLALYDPLRRRIESLADAWFNSRGRRLELTLSEVDRALSRALSLQGLDHALLGRLAMSGRVPLASLYLRDPDTGLFRMVLCRGSGDRAQMQTISAQPFAEGFQKGVHAYVRVDLARAARLELTPHGRARAPGRAGRLALDDAAARLRTMDAMDADLTIPFRSADIVLGWLNLKDEVWSDGFSSDEVRHLVATVDRATHVLENIDAVEQLKEQHRLAALGTMAAGLAHEIRNPLAGIKGAAQLLQGEEDPQQIEEFLQVIVGETNRLNTVVAHFLDYSRPFEVHAVPNDINTLVRRSLDVVRAQDLPTAIQIEAILDPDLPPVEVDADMLHQVLLNLVHNAIQALRDQGHVQVITRTTRARFKRGPAVNAVEISVIDDGPGIAAEDLDKLFIPFFTTRPDGTGLGLPISRRLMEAQGGDILVRTRPGHSTTFIVRLPLRQDTGSAASSLSSPNSSP
ncbi:MAG: hypothetical protein GXP62_01250 [Oligoflexia bacterium]|nr:hypothetical protein [Oligoflexia bacterium]